MDTGLQIACEMTEIELKKISPCGFGSPGGRLRCYGKCSRAKTLEFFVKRCGSLDRNILLVINTILQNVKLTLFTSFGALDISPWFFRNFRQKVGNLAYPLQKIGNVYSSQFGNAPTESEPGHE